MCAASKMPKIGRLGQELKQRTCTEAIQAEEDFNFCVWGFKAEVGYRMGARPTPMMSANNPARPSRFPLGVGRKEGLFSKSEFEDNPKGRMRIPDCIILKVTAAEILQMRMSGTIDWKRFIPTQDQIDTVLEMKFGTDDFGREQQEAYQEIAGTAKLRMLRDIDCNCDRRRKKKPAPEFPPIKNPYLPPIMQPSRMQSALKIPFGNLFNPLAVNKRSILKNEPMPLSEYLDRTTALKVAGTAVVVVGVIALAPEIAAGAAVVATAARATAAALVVYQYATSQ